MVSLFILSQFLLVVSEYIISTSKLTFNINISNLPIGTSTLAMRSNGPLPQVTNIPMILANFLETIIQFLWKTSVMTMVTLASSSGKKLRIGITWYLWTYTSKHSVLGYHIAFSILSLQIGMSPGGGCPSKVWNLSNCGNWYSIKPYWLVLPWSWPMFFEKIDIACEGNSLKSREYLRSWHTSQTEGLYFGPKRISHSSVTIHDWVL